MRPCMPKGLQSIPVHLHFRNTIMRAKKLPTILGRLISISAMGFLFWTLSSSTFLDATTSFVGKNLDSIQQLNDRTGEYLASLTQPILR